MLQQMLLGVGAVADKTYIDDIFSTYVYTGTGSARSINNGINFSEDGGMLWTKRRESDNHKLFDTVRGYKNSLESNSSNAEFEDTAAQYFLSSFNNNGFSWASGHSYVNASGGKYATWSFKKAPGFFDIVSYTGNGTAGRQIAHSLASVPGMVIVRRRNGASNWACYHRGTDATAPEDYWMTLNATYARQDQPHWNDTKPTSTHFTVGNDYEVNANNQSYIAYLFAGGKSDAATARSVDLDGSGDYLSTSSSSSDFTMGTGDFTVECWAKPNANSSDQPLFQISDTSGGFKDVGYNNTLTVWHRPDGNWVFCANGSEQETSGFKPVIGAWYHMALVRNSGTTTLYVNGIKVKSATDNTNYDGTYIVIGGYYAPLYDFDGNISNFRVVKGTAVYTSSFRPPTEPLTNVTNTKLLCCNNSSTTGSTVTPVTIDSDGDPTASTDSPFDDPAGFVFGDSKEGIIKCGSYTTDSNEDATVNLGFEPQWVLTKRTDSTGDWRIFDSLRGLGNAQDIAANISGSKYLLANDSGGEANSSKVGLTSTGFYADQDGTNRTYIYVALRRPDGYVGKPPELGTDVFNVVAGVTGPPSFVTTFAPDMGFWKNNINTTSDWNLNNRLTGQKYLKTNASSAEGDGGTNMVWDHNNGFSKNNAYFQVASVFKRHAGFDVVTYKGNSSSVSNIPGRDEPHSMGVAPQMMWIKAREDISMTTENWIVYHKDLTTGDYLKLNTNDAAVDYSMFGDKTPTTTHFTVGSGGSVNNNGKKYIALLFSSISGISKVGSYTGNGTSGSSTQTITTGFEPRFVIIKRTDSSNSYTGWIVLDTTRGWGNSADDDDKALFLNSSDAQGSSTQYGEPTSTGFIVAGDHYATNTNNGEYIYYCHS